jgi:hypothetical protein
MCKNEPRGEGEGGGAPPYPLDSHPPKGVAQAHSHATQRFFLDLTFEANTPRTGLLVQTRALVSSPETAQDRTSGLGSQHLRINQF